MGLQENIAKESWLTAPATQKLMAALMKEGAVARFVGGCVRDSLLGQLDENREIDIAIDVSAQHVITLLEKAGLKPIPIGLAHGTVGCVIDGRHFEITTLRVDVKTDGRHAEVAFTKDWQEDAKRRDFTINALYADDKGTLYDPLNGRADLEKRLVRFIGDPHQRIEEDFLRILRFFRFFALIASGEVDRQGLEACSEKKAGLQQLSAERVRDELLRLLAAERAPEALRLMAAAGILSLVLPNAHGTKLFESMHQLTHSNFITPDPIRLLASFYDTHEEINADAKRLKLSNAQAERLEKIFAPDTIAMKSYLSIREVRKLLYLLGVETFSDKVWLNWAKDENRSNDVGWRALLALADSWEKPTFPLTGRMVKAAGVPEGEMIGRIMKEVEEWWIDTDFIDDEFSIIERLKAIVQATIYVRR